MVKYKYTEFEEIYNKLVEVVANDITHEHYANNICVSKFWKKMVTGKGHQDFIASYRPSESEGQISQKFRVYKPRTQYLLNRVNTLIKKSDRVDFAIDQISYEGADQTKVDDLHQRLDCLHANKSAKYWINQQFNYLNRVDPNAFMVINFYPFDPTKEKAYSYPIVVRSENAIDFEKVNGNLQYLVFDSNVTVQCEANKTDIARRYHILAPNYTICLEEIKQNQITADDQREIRTITKEGQTDPQSYFIEVYKTDSKNVPACQVGYYEDPNTDGCTYESICYPVKEILLDHINKKSELDVIILTHGIAQKFALIPKCKNVDADNNACVFGKVKGKTCKKCKGTGQQPFHTSSQDIITLNFTFDERMPVDQMMDMSKMIHYANIPQNVIDLYDKQVKELEIDVSHAMFNVDLFTKDHNEAKTPEAIRSRNDSLNNVLFEYCTHKAEKYTFLVKQVADNAGQLEGLQCNFSPSTDFKLENIDDLLDQLEAAKDAPKEVKGAILSKIHHKQNQDNPEVINAINAREKWRPFTHLTETERMNILDILPDYHPERILWLNFNRIFNDIENSDTINIDENTSTRLKFYEIKNHDVQKQIISYYVKLYTDELKELSEGQDTNLSFELSKIDEETAV